MSIQRFKGLGEMNPEELWSTTLDPETRNLLQVQYSKDLKKDQNLIHTLMGNDVALRKDFIVSNAINVQNLRHLIMKFFETSKYFSLKKSTYINLRWIAIIGQLITINLVYFILILNLILLANLIIFVGI